jgi:uncharacterized delta-60 repeat protein
LDPSGKILAAGMGFPDDMIISRYNEDGTHDLSVNGQGWVTNDNAGGGNGQDWGKDITVDPSGGIVVTGKSLGSVLGQSVEVMVIWRYNDNGSLDTSFNSQGWVFHHGAAGVSDRDGGRAIALDGLGRILVAGFGSNGSDFDMATWRYTRDGRLDTTFRGQGWLVEHDAAGGNDSDMGQDIAVDAMGRIVVAGVSRGPGAAGHMVIWRYLEDGSRDTTFNSQGWVVDPDDKAVMFLVCGVGLAVDDMGRYLVTGSRLGVPGNPTLDMMIWRYMDNGDRDLTFNGQGWVSHDGAAAESSTDDWGNAVAVDGLGRILVGGASEGGTSGVTKAVIWRYEEDGTLDTTFNQAPSGGPGWLLFGGDDSRVCDLAIDDSCRIVAVGENQSGDTTVWRFE